MPQLDKVTFFSQFVWLCFFYLGFYGVVVKFILPKFGRIFKVREKKLSASSQGVTALHQEKSTVGTGVALLLDQGVSTSKQLVESTGRTTGQWIDRVVAETNARQWKDANTSYLRAVGEQSLAGQLGLSLSLPQTHTSLRSAVLLRQLAYLAQTRASQRSRAR
jgi:hypothetical protein